MWKKQYLKYKELLRRQVCKIPPRVYGLSVLLFCLVCVQFWLHQNLHIVYVTDSDGASQLITTVETRPAQLMQLAGISAEGDDRVTYTNYAENLSNLNIRRAFPVKLTADGQSYEVQMVEGTVQEVLEKTGVVLNEHDFTQPSLHAEVQPGTEILVSRVTYVDTVTTEEIPYETVYSYTSEFYKNKRRTVTRQTGQTGELTITHRERWVDGQLTSSQEIGRQVTRQPRNEIVRAYQAGAPVSPLTGPDGTTNPPSSYKAVLNGKATGYHSRTGGRGASRLGLRYGTVAVDPKIIPYGSLLYIRGTGASSKFVYGYAIATDTGTALQDGRVLVDLYYETPEEARINGAQSVDVYIVK